jgi:hypothetical protein
LDAYFFHYGLDEGFGTFDAGENGLEVEGWLGGVAGGGAVNAVLADHDEGVSEEVHGDGESSAFGAHHELVAVELGALFVEDVHELRVTDGMEGVMGRETRFGPGEIYTSLSEVDRAGAKLRS